MYSPALLSTGLPLETADPERSAGSSLSSKDDQKPIVNLANLKAKQGTINLPAREEYWPSTTYNNKFCLEVTHCIHLWLIPFTNTSHHCNQKTENHRERKVPYHSKATDCVRECVVLSVEEESNVVIA